MDDHHPTDLPGATLVLHAKDLGLLVKRARKAAKIPINQAALLAGVSKQFLSDLERGKPSVQFDKALAVAQEFGIELAALPRGLAAMQRGGKP